jgi:hypothetical protein
MIFFLSERQREAVKKMQLVPTHKGEIFYLFRFFLLFLTNKTKQNKT